MISCIICSVLQLIISVLVLKVFPFWNPDFGVQLKIQLGDQLEGIADFLKHWNGEFISNCFLGIIGIATLLEIGVTVYKTLRYGVEKRTSIGK